MENPKDYEQNQGLEAQLDYNDFPQEDPEINENITELQDTFHDQEMGIIDNPAEYAQTEGLDAQLDYQNFDENPEFNEPVTELQENFHDQEMGVIDGMQEPTAAGSAYDWDEEDEKSAAGQGFGA